MHPVTRLLAALALTATAPAFAQSRLTVDDAPLQYVPLDEPIQPMPQWEPEEPAGPSEGEAQCLTKCDASYDTCANTASYDAALCIEGLRVKSRLGEITDDQYETEFDVCLAKLTQKQTECLLKLELCQSKCEGR